MYIAPLDNYSFTSRNKVIRRADDIARHVNKKFPRISSTIVADYSHADEFRNVVNAIIYDNIISLRSEEAILFDDAETLMAAADSFILPVKKHKRGNCFESAALSALTAKANGINKVYLAKLLSKIGGNVRDQDHAVLLVNGTKPYVIDAWLGFADYVPEAFLKYKKEFSYHFDIREGEKLFFKKNNGDFSRFLNYKFNNKFIKALLNRYPELRIK